jgi:sn-glycerol 3-phosphate transport system substrate-binding protein
VLGEPVVLDDIIAPVRAYYTLDGVFTSMPWNSSTPILYANMEMLAAAGVTELPTTWQEVEAACAAYLAAMADAQGCITWPNHGWFFEQWMAQRGAVLANNDNGRAERATEVLLGSEDAVAVMSWWQNMHSQGYYNYSGVQRDWGATEQAIETGTLPMIITSSADAVNITRIAGENNITITTGRMPYDSETGWTGNLIGGASLWLSDGLDTVVEDGALAFLQFLNNTENAAAWASTVTGYIPITTSAAALLEEQGWYDENPNFRVAFDQINDSEVTIATSGALLGTFRETRDIVTQAIEDLMLQGGDAAERMATAAADANALLADYNALYAQ